MYEEENSYLDIRVRLQAHCPNRRVCVTLDKLWKKNKQYNQQGNSLAPSIVERVNNGRWRSVFFLCTQTNPVQVKTNGSFTA